MQWTDTQPIFQQIHQRVVAMILNGQIPEGDAIPSIRQVAMDLEVNPLTVTKAYQLLTDAGIVEKRRGMGLFVVEGARERLLETERQRFLTEDWPRIAEKIATLGLDAKTLLNPKSKK